MLEILDTKGYCSFIPEKLINLTIFYIHEFLLECPPTKGIKPWHKACFLYFVVLTGNGFIICIYNTRLQGIKNRDELKPNYKR